MAPRRRLRRLQAAGAVACLLIAVGSTDAFGVFGASATSPGPQVTTSILTAPGTPGLVSSTCTAGGRGTLSVSWTATRSPYATGYSVTYTESGVSGTTTHTTTATSDSGPVTKKNSSLTVAVKATYQSWTSAAATASLPNPC